MSSMPLLPTHVDAPVVDCHAHVWNQDMPLAATAWHRPPGEATIEQYVATLDAHGVTFAVLAAASIHGTYNDYMIEACRRHKRLRTTVILKPDAPLRQMKELAANGAVGVRLQLRNVKDVPDLTSPEYRQFLGRIADLGWHVHLHDDSFRLPNYLDALEASGVNLVVDHFGRPDRGIDEPGFQRVLRSVEKGRTWVKLSASFRLPSEDLRVQAANTLLQHAGPERLLWGSDWPFAAFETTMDYGQAVASLQRLVPDPVARRRIGCETPLKLYFT
ncbi:amidohydrolase family protein [Ramlibacter sp. G-1-2-2]|uniref:Amidohydrolase family protein n=2 Tax=Ramlibacter agri TaxID=2728837 RepID=A0A848HBL5_9BURK|nr:amidohydrolase family protein [Ramlibacter agri]